MRHAIHIFSIIVISCAVGCGRRMPNLAMASPNVFTEGLDQIKVTNVSPDHFAAIEKLYLDYYNTQLQSVEPKLGYEMGEDLKAARIRLQAYLEKYNRNQEEAAKMTLQILKGLSEGLHQATENIKQQGENQKIFQNLHNGQNANILEQYKKVKQDMYKGSVAIVLVHGNRSENRQDNGWTQLFQRVKFRTKIYNWQHNTGKPIGFNGSTGNAQELADYVKSIPEEKLILLAHSRGGLVCRAFMNYNNQGDRVLGLITLGTPHHGSPLAVPDWVAELWKQNGHTIDTYDKAVGSGCGVFDVSRIGDLNLAWDNMDSAVGMRNAFAFSAAISAEGFMQLTESDLNLRCSRTDKTSFYRNQYKEEYGTLEELNKNEKFQTKIVAIAAVNGEAGKDPRSADLVIGSIFKDEHMQLDALSGRLASFDWCLGSNCPNYIANDGMVPLQSALFLDIAGGVRFAERSSNGGILVNWGAVREKAKVKHYVLLGANHLDLIETDTSAYWNWIIGEINRMIAMR